MNRPLFELADVVRLFGTAYEAAYPSPFLPAQQQAMKAITRCRTAVLGGHVEVCDECDHRRIAYNSCRNRNCPKCQASVAAGWLDEQAKHLLPVEYFHVVFTLPNAIGPLAQQNPKKVYGALFQAVADSLSELAADPKHLGAEIGFLAVLHTWGQTLALHPHVHCVVPGGGLAPDGRWKSCRPGFFLPVKPLSRLFRSKFLDLLTNLYTESELVCAGQQEELADPRRFAIWMHDLRRTDWVVYSKPPFGGPQQVLKYLARYTHRIAISNHRLVDVNGERVSFQWKDYSEDSESKIMTLEGVEFLRRFLQHVLPSGFVRIRHFGFLANRCREEKLAHCRAALSVKQPPTPDEVTEDFDESPICPSCSRGRLVIVEVVPRASQQPPTCGSAPNSS